MKEITLRTETRDESTFIVAEGPSSNDIARELHQRLVAGINGKIDMEIARQLVRLGWTPPPGHPVTTEPPDQIGSRKCQRLMNPTKRSKTAWFP